MNKQKLDVAKYFIVKILTGIISLFTASMYSKLLLPDQYGDYSLIISLINVLIAILIGWIASSALRYYDTYKDNKKIFFTNVLIDTAIMIAVMLIAIMILRFIMPSIKIEKYLIFTIIIAINLSLVEVFEKIFRASQKTNVYTFAILFQSIINIVIFYICVKFFDLGITSIFLSNIISNFFFLIIAMVTLKSCSYLDIRQYDKQINLVFLKYGIPMIGVWGVSWLLNYSDRYIISIFFSSYEVGIYEMSYKIAENSINMLVSSFTLAVYPMFISVWNKFGKKEVEIKLKEVLNYYFLIAVPAVAGLILICDKLYMGIIDSQYMSGKWIIIIVAIGIFINGINSLLNKIWQLNEKTKNIFYIMLLSVVFNIVLNIIFIPKFGIIAAAVTTLASYILTIIITISMVRKEFRIMVSIKKLLKIVFATIIMSIFLLLTQNYVTNLVFLAIQIILAVIIYFAVNLFIGNLNEEIEMIKEKLIDVRRKK